MEEGITQEMTEGSTAQADLSSGEEAVIVAKYLLLQAAKSGGPMPNRFSQEEVEARLGQSLYDLIRKGAPWFTKSFRLLILKYRPEWHLAGQIALEGSKFRLLALARAGGQCPDCQSTDPETAELGRVLYNTTLPRSPLFDRSFRDAIVEAPTFDVHGAASPEAANCRKGRGLVSKDRKAYVLSRDGHRCQKCNARGPKLEVHHIVFKCNGGTNAATNLVALCEECHAGIHTLPQGSAQSESLKLITKETAKARGAPKASSLRS